MVDWEGSPLQPRLAVLRKVVVLGDAAPWIWHLAADQFGERVEILTCYHASQHLSAVAQALLGTRRHRWPGRTPASPRCVSWG